MNEPVVWEPEDRFYITGHGPLFTGPSPFNGSPIGRQVIVDGDLYEVIGSESIGGHPAPTKGMACGLLLRPLDKDSEG